jgi:integrase
VKTFTKRTLEALPAGGARGTWYAETGAGALPGFYVVVYASGTKVFFARYRQGMARRFVRIGRFNPLTLDQARIKAKSVLAHAQLGDDPQAAQRRARKMPTFEAWRKAYIGRIVLRKRSPREDKRFLKRAAARWGAMPLDSITREDVAAFHQSLGKEHPTAANRFLASVRAAFAEALRDGLVRVNPATGVKHHREGPPRARVLTEPEMHAILGAIVAEPDEYARAGLRILVETGARLSEALRAKWEDVDFEGATWRLPSPKSGYPQIVPLPRSTVALLRRLPRIVGCPFIVAGRKANRPRADLRDAWARVKAAAGKTAPSVVDVHIHDLRRSFGLAIARAHGLHVASKLLRHSSTKVTEQVYAPLGLDELRKAVEKRADALPFAPKKTRR